LSCTLTAHLSLLRKLTGSSLQHQGRRSSLPFKQQQVRHVRLGAHSTCHALHTAHVRQSVYCTGVHSPSGPWCADVCNCLNKEYAWLLTNWQKCATEKLTNNPPGRIGVCACFWCGAAAVVPLPTPCLQVAAWWPPVCPAPW
jgi:hypothetical protein